MIRITIPFLRPAEEELAGGVQKLRDLKALVKSTTARLERILKALEVLEDNGWTWETSYNDIIVFKPHFFRMTKRDAQAELKRMKIDLSLAQIETVGAERR